VSVLPAPPLEPRTAAELAAATRTALQAYLAPPDPLVPGSRGFHVLWLQRQLAVLATVDRDLDPGAADGTFGHATGLAVRAFKRGRGLDDDAVVDAATWAALIGDHPSDPVPGEALVRIFARLVEIAASRVNGLPDKNMLAFLELVGVALKPPQPARVPLTFHLAAGSTGVVRVPAGTEAAAVAAEGEADPPVFETERELLATSTALVETWTREPARDRYAEQTAVALGRAAGTFDPFAGTLPIDHVLYLGDSLLAIEQPKDVVIHSTPVADAVPWPRALAWERWDGTAWQPVQAAPTIAGGGWSVMLPGIAQVPPQAVAERTSSWIRARLATPLPPADPPAAGVVGQGGLVPDAASSDDEPQDPAGPLYPFGDTAPRQSFSIACARAFSKPGAEVRIDVQLDPSRPAGPSGDLVLAWTYWNGSAWAQLGLSTGTTEALGEWPAFDDGTLALTRDGTVAFRAPADWLPTAIGDDVAHRLRVTVAAGDFGSVEAYRPPVVQTLTLSYGWPLPQIGEIDLRVSIRGRTLAPDLAFTNEAPVDLSKDFLPFGPTPSFNDAFALACDAAFARPRTRVTMTFTPTTPPNPTDAKPAVTWEYWSTTGGRWTKLDAADETDRLRTGGRVQFEVPPDLGAVEVAGQLHPWVRVRVTGGDYGHGVQYEPNDEKDTAAGFKVIKATLAPPSIATLSIDYDFNSGQRAPEHVLAVNDFAVVEPPAGSAFTPFVPTEDTRPTLYVGANGDFGNAPTTLYFDVADVPYQPGSERSRAAAEPPLVAWEYWNGADWSPLGVRDETQAFTRRGLVVFVAPADLASRNEFGADAYWLRARWERGVYPALPRLARVLPNTTWAANVATVAGEVLGSSSGEHDQSFGATRPPVLPGQAVEVREPEQPSPVELAVLLEEEGDDALNVVLDPAGAAAEVWVRWHEVVDFAASEPRSRHYVLDRLTGEVQFGDGQNGMAPPAGTANVRIGYRTGGGARGNRPPGSIAQLKSAVPYVDAVTNWDEAAGGADAESLVEARVRGPRTLRHRDRAVATADLEDLAREASLAVARVRAVGADSGADAGSVGVIVVPHGDEAKPVPSLEVLNEVRDYLERRLSPVADLWVGGPGWLRVTVRAEIAPVAIEDAIDVESAVRARLAAFLHPLVGGLAGAGWPFGRAPHRSDLLALVESVPGVDHVRSLVVSELLTDPPPVRDAVLVYGGDHELSMVGGTEELE
jgi:hypothetical protein